MENNTNKIISEVLKELYSNYNWPNIHILSNNSELDMYFCLNENPIKKISNWYKELGLEVEYNDTNSLYKLIVDLINKVKFFNQKVFIFLQKEDKTIIFANKNNSLDRYRYELSGQNLYNFMENRFENKDEINEYFVDKIYERLY